MIEQLTKAIIDAGPPFYTAALSVVLNVVLLLYIRGQDKEGRGLQRETVEAMNRSSIAIEASSGAREDGIDLAKDNHQVQMLQLGKIESLLANARVRL